MNIENGLLLIDKPSGITSFGVIRRLRKALDTRKIGHGGTLDPMASGLLIVGVAEGTKKLTAVIGADKTYEATIQFGAQTTTGDADGEIVATNTHVHVNAEKLCAALQAIHGSHILPVSKYSAVKQGGVPIYRRVRRGESVIIPKREMVVYVAELQSFDEEKQTAEVLFKVASGTYIRSLAEAIAKELGTLAHLTALRRTTIGEYSIDDARTLEGFA